MKPPVTGMPGLDAILHGLRAGDNVVFQVDSINDYRRLVDPYVRTALDEGRTFIYIRFAEHPPLCAPDPRITVHHLDPAAGFEHFSSQVHTIIRDAGRGAYYLFDCLSDLLTPWATDLMIGNFFRITCPFLYELDTITYFALMRNMHSFKAVARIRETTQLLLDIYDLQDGFFVHPLKVDGRYSPTMFFPHRETEGRFEPVAGSVDAAGLFAYIAERAREGATRQLDSWDRLFMRAHATAHDGAPDEQSRMVDTITRVLLSRDPRVQELARASFTLEDLIAIKSRMIGTGFIGGKSAGMLLARAILRRDREFDWGGILEDHDSYFIGSDVFYTVLVQNGLWKQRMEQKTSEGYFAAAPELGRRIRESRIPDDIREQLYEMIEYFGQSPIIVRSSSLLEDGFGNAFAGKYESIFSVNQGSPEERCRALEDHMRSVYASTMNEDALAYRRQRGLDGMDEQMSILVQRVSGAPHGRYFYPDAAGVGISYNTFVWNDRLDPSAGMLRIVYGLGTRAVNRVEDDYPRTVALDDPLLRPYSEIEDGARYSQRSLDVLDLDANHLGVLPVAQAAAEHPSPALALIGSVDAEAARALKALGGGYPPWIVNFNRLFSSTDFGPVMRRMLSRLASVYQYPVDIEFTVNFDAHGGYRANLLQCRPLQTKGAGPRVTLPERIPFERLLFETAGSFMGGNASLDIRRVIAVDPARYDALDESGKYAAARCVGAANRAAVAAGPVLLIGPGRWGTSTPSLGVPVSFAEINNVAVLVELEFAGAAVTPELSFGTHFFQDLVETNISYVAVFSRGASRYNPSFLGGLSLGETGDLCGDERLRGVVRVFDLSERPLSFMTDVVSRRAVCFLPEGR